MKAFSHRAKQCVHLMPRASAPGLILEKSFNHHVFGLCYDLCGAYNMFLYDCDLA